MKSWTGKPVCIALFATLSMAVVAPGRAQKAEEPDPPPARHSLVHRLGDTLGDYIHTPVRPKGLKWKAIAVPAALIGYGTLSVTSGWLNDINLTGRRWASNGEDPNQKTSIDDYLQFAPGAAVYGLRIAGIRGKNNIIDETFLYAISGTLMNVIVRPLKNFTAERRPDSSDSFSFPSGHTATAFVSAEFLRQEYKDRSVWIGAGGYAAAILTGYLRMYNNKHWFSDVAAGAGIGILSTRVTYWVYPKVKNLLLGKSARGNAIILPTYEGGSVGLCFVRSL